MSPITHLLVSWGVANVAALNRRERAFVTLAGVLPDLDGLGAIPELLTQDSSQPVLWWSRYHHVLFHNLGFGLLIALAAVLFCTHRWMTGSLALLSFHLHLLGDIVGARGPDGYQWPIPYLRPFSEDWQVVWKGQWELNAWPNFLITIAFLVLAFYLAWLRGRSPVELVSSRADQALVTALRRRFGPPRSLPEVG